MKALLQNALVTAVIVAIALLGYDRAVRRPANLVGLIDVSEIMKLQNERVMAVVTRASSSEKDRKEATDFGVQFSAAFPQALERLSEECGCLVLTRSAVAGVPPNSVDLTPALKQMVGL
jgi:hypothetical protein